MTKQILGHIDCPSCGYKEGMRVTLDKNNHPFGFCEAECGQQLRVGGDPRRVAKFVSRFPWASAVPVTVTDTVTEAAPTPAAPKAVPIAAPEPALAPAKAAPAPKPAPTPPAPAKSGWFTPIMGVKNA